MAENDTNERAKFIVSKLDSIPKWALSYIFIGILGVGFFFTFFDIFNINVSIIQTGVEIIHGGVLPSGIPNFPLIETYLGYATVIQLIGYAIGTLILSPLSDRYGRRNLLLVTMLVAALGSLITVFVTNFFEFALGRFITGLGIGADIAIVNTYISETAPKSKRVGYGSFVFFFSAVGTIVAIWLGLYLTTAAAPFPNGLPFAIGGPGAFGGVIGWRLMYAVGAALGFIGVFLRLELPESPRWLISKGRLDEAEKIVDGMLARVKKKTGKDVTIIPEVDVTVIPKASPYHEIFSNAKYRNRAIQFMVLWFIGYMAVYILAAGFTGLLGSIGYTASRAGVVVAIGSVGFIPATMIPTFYGNIFKRKTWLPIGAIITLVGGLVITFSGTDTYLSAFGAILAFMGFNIWVPVTYIWSTEIFPARARSTGFALVDGIGHIGGGVGVLFVAFLLSKDVAALYIFILIAVFLFIPSGIARFGAKTEDVRLDEVSP